MTNDVYINRDIHDEEIRRYRSVLKEMGVEYNKVTKKYLLTKRLSEEQQKCIEQLKSIITKLEKNETPKIKIDNKVGGVEELSAWCKEFGIDEKEYDEYVKDKLNNTHQYISKYI